MSLNGVLVRMALATLMLGACDKGRSKGLPATGAGSGGAGDPDAASGDALISADAVDDGAASQRGEDASKDAPDAPILPQFEAQTLTIANAYLSWGRVDDEWRWAPSLCRLPLPGVARASESNDPATHGQKLYSVFVKNRDAYPMGSNVDQVVVKQSWTAELVPGPDAAYQPNSYRPDGSVGTDSDHFYPYAHADGGVYRAAAPAGLFIMFKVDPSTPETDEGWVYASVSAAGKVTSAGRVASCMGCHEVAPYDRLFGVPKTPS